MSGLDATTLMVAALGVGAVWLVSVWLTGLSRKYALSIGAVDTPNQRSSHTAPTPRGGGVATVITTTAALVILAWLGRLPMDVLAALGGGGVVVAGIGFLDDHRRVSARARLVVHIGAAIWAVTIIGGLPPLQIGEQLFVLGWGGYALGVLCVVWSLNLFNFMDGIDGLAAAEAIFIVLGGALVAFLSGPAGTVPVVAAVIAAACAGFLVWNWPPAKIFMGDVGSGYLGYVVVVLALIAARENPVALFAWTILGGVFFVDATLTLIRRCVRRERVYEAHRSHAYQRLARRWNSHARVTVAVTVINIAWLLPAALLATLYPSRAGWIAAAALVPLLIAAVFAGAGRVDVVAKT